MRRLRRGVTGALTWGAALGAVVAWAAASRSVIPFLRGNGISQGVACGGLLALEVLALLALRPSWWATSPGRRALSPWLLAWASPALFIISFGHIIDMPITQRPPWETSNAERGFEVLASLWLLLGVPFARRGLQASSGRGWLDTRPTLRARAASAATAGLAVLLAASVIRTPWRRSSYVDDLPVGAVLPAGPPEDAVDSIDPPRQSREVRALGSAWTLGQRCKLEGCTVEVLLQGNGGVRRALGPTSASLQAVHVDEQEGLLVMEGQGRVFAFDLAEQRSTELHLARVASQLKAPLEWVAGAGVALLSALVLRIARWRAARALELLSYGAQATASGGWLRFDDGREDRLIPGGITVRPGRVVVVTWSAGKADPYRGGTDAGAEIDVYPGSLARLMQKASANVAALDGFTVALASLGGAPLLAAAMIGLA